MDREHIIRRLRYLRNWEFVNVFLMPLFICMSLVVFWEKDWLPFGLGAFLISYILAQGTFYWHLKLRSVQENRGTLPPYFHRLFTFFKRSNIALIALYPILAVAGWLLPGLHFHAPVLAHLVYGFGVLEQVNYYYYQLSHDNANDIRYLLKYKRLRRSPLWVDLRKAGREKSEET
ncbi:MAG: hypothetical protein RBT75_02400 [Anaerolineae bacterium]|jgi:hypothetical protein|nr:hypothetical protein [Anaerolineae bacterium]